jgi:hypothetical protein
MQDTNFLNANASSEGMTTVALLKLFYTGWRLIFSVLLISLITAGVYLATTQNQYESTLLLKVGQTSVSDSDKFGKKLIEMQIEGVDDAINRMNSKDFKDSIIMSLGWQGEENARLLLRTYKVYSPENKYLKIIIRSLSPADALQAAATSMNLLSSAHKDIFDKIEYSKRMQLSEIESKIISSNAYLMNLEKVINTSTKLKNELSTVTLLQVINNESSRLESLKMEQLYLIKAMDSDLNKQTTVVEAFTADHPVQPNVLRVWLFAVIIGFILGMLMVLFRSLPPACREGGS